MKNKKVHASRNSCQFPSRYLVWVLEGDLETQDSQHEEFTLHDTVPERPEAGVQLQRFTARVKVPARETAVLMAAREASLGSPSSPLVSRHKLQCSSAR